jgi:antitoxin YefM
MAITASEARKRLFPLIEEINDDQEAVEILSKGGTAFLVPEAQWRSLQETAHLMRSPANAQRLLDSVAAIERGDYAEHALLSPMDEATPQAS